MSTRQVYMHKIKDTLQALIGWTMVHCSKIFTAVLRQCIKEIRDRNSNDVIIE